MAAEEIGNLIPTKIPGYADDADIQAALRVYHYGSYDYSPSNTSPASLVSPSIAKTIYDIEQDILSLESSKISTTIFTAKGNILTASAANTPTVLSVGTNNQFLIANSGTATGLEWTNTLASPIVSGLTLSDANIIFEGTTADDFETTLTVVNPTADRTITLPNISGTVVTTGDTATVTSTMISSLAWSKLTSTPTTLSGYGITDALSNSSSSTQSGYFGDIFLYDDSTPSHYLQITNSANLTASRILSINVNDAARTISLSGNLTVSSATTISGTNTGDQTITLTGDVTGTGTGSFATTLATVATAGTYKSVTINAKGLVTSGTNPTTLSGYGITDALSNSTSSTQNGYFGDIFLYDDSTPSHYLQITNSANLTAARTLSINVNDAARTVSLSGNLTVSAAATVSGTNTGDQTITLTGDVTGTGTGSFATALANSGVTAGTYNNSATAVTPITVDVKGRVTGTGTAVTITPAWSSITSKPTTLSGFGITDALDTSATAQTKAGNLTAAQFIRSGGTSSQFLKADGSIDSSTYLTTGTASSTYAALSGATFTGSVITAAASTSATGIRLPHGSAPTSPTNGDLWTTTSGLFVRINGSTVGPVGAPVSGDSDQIVLGMQIFF